MAQAFSKMTMPGLIRLKFSESFREDDASISHMERPALKTELNPTDNLWNLIQQNLQKGPTHQKKKKKKNVILVRKQAKIVAAQEQAFSAKIMK